jgi:diguanylate cyclase (GGDEF)-like protein
MSWRELDPAALSPRIAAVIYLAAGLFASAAIRVAAPGVADTGTLVSISIASALFGAIAIVLPWQRWPLRAQLVIPVFALVLFAWGGILTTDGAAPFLAALPLPFVYVGFTQRPGTSSALVPVAAVSLLAAARFDVSQILGATVLFALPVSVLVGEMIAQSQLQRSRAERRVDRLLLAVRTLGRVDDERAGADLVAMLASELLGAQAVAVLLADRRNSRRYRNRSFFGHPALADAAPLLLDGLGDKAEGTHTRFVTLKRQHRAVRAAAIMPLPGEDGVAVGLVVAMWGTPKRVLPAPARQAAELLSEEAGRMFQRLRAAAALEHDAHTDPLTQLANRRTFARALQTIQPGDALVIVDLDHFKTVNDRFGHQTGDDTLRALAGCLRETARQVDCVARFGGEEFAVVVAGAGAAGARALLRRMRRTWASRNPITTFSAGIAVHDGTCSANETLRRADAALYEAKANGRDCDVFAAEAEVVLP